MSKDLFMDMREREELGLLTTKPNKKMKIQLQRPIAFIDIEATGADREKDRIVEISICKLLPTLERNVLTMRINPGIAIPADVVAIHGITWDDVKNEPKFSEVAGALFDFLAGCDVGGFNSNAFDIPMLFNEFSRAGLYWDYTQFLMVDVGNLFKIKEPRTLTAAYRFYCGRDLEGAHGAQADIFATVDVYMEMLKRYDDLPDTLEELALVTNYNKPILDLSGKFYLRDDGQIAINFGKHRDQPAKDHLDFISWMLYKADFPKDTQNVCRRLLGKPVAQ